MFSSSVHKSLSHCACKTKLNSLNYAKDNCWLLVYRAWWLWWQLSWQWRWYGGHIVHALADNEQDRMWSRRRQKLNQNTPGLRDRVPHYQQHTTLTCFNLYNLSTLSHSSICPLTGSSTIRPTLLVFWQPISDSLWQWHRFTSVRAQVCSGLLSLLQTAECSFLVQKNWKLRKKDERHSHCASK